MTFSKSALAGVCILGLALIAAAGEDNAKKIVGKWEVTKAKGAPEGATVEFTKEGKMKIRFKVGDKNLEIDGTYKVEKEKLSVTLSFEGKTKSDSSTIKKLTDKELHLEDEKGVTEEYKRAK